MELSFTHKKKTQTKLLLSSLSSCKKKKRHTRKIT